MLASFLLRVDGVIIRLVETRIFHQFGTHEVIRHWSWRERELNGLVGSVALRGRFRCLFGIQDAAPLCAKVDAAVAQGLIGCESLAEDEGSLCFELCDKFTFNDSL